MKLEASPSSTALSTAPRTAAQRALSLTLVLWAAAAVAITASGALARHPHAVPLALLGAVVVGVASATFAPSVRRAAGEIPLGAILAFHALRLPIGVAFLVELASGRLPATFAIRGGYGDIVVGALALALMLGRRRPRWALALWSAFGLLDILVVAGTANYLVFVAKDPTMLSAFSRVPYPMLPTFVVPLVILTHLEIFRRLRAGR